MVEHTPGPWHWDDWAIYEGKAPDFENSAPWIVDGQGNPVLTGKIVCENPANATLIIAAPDLLDALEALTLEANHVADSSFIGTMDAALKRAHAAIASARATEPGDER